MRPLQLVAVLAFLLTFACGGDDGGPDCRTAGDCAAGEMCRDARCVPGATDAGVDAPPADGGGGDTGACVAGERACGAECCGAGEVCGTDTECCAREVLCGTECCNEGQVCEGALCRLDCGATTRCEDAEGTETCCAEGEVCANGACFAPETECTDFVDCGADEYCEPTLGRCLPQPGGETCATEPSGGDVAPTLVWHWDGAGAAMPGHVQVMMAPMVANLDDDDGDGDVDGDDTPDVVFNTFDPGAGSYTSNGVLRAVRGADGTSLFDVTAAEHRVVAGSQVAIGDIDGDGLNEIVTCGSSATGIGPLIAFENDGTFKWRATDPNATCGQAAPAIADLDADGTPEVFVHYTVVDGATGALEWHRDCVGTGGWATSSHSPCDYTTAADLDDDGQLEVVGGNVAYRADGTSFYDRTADFRDGYPAVADLDLDGTPEIVVVHSAFTPSPYAGDHWLRALNADGTDRFGPIDLNAGAAPATDVDAGTVGGGGPPTIANFDDDPEPEIAAAGAYAYAVFEADGAVKWVSISNDRSSRKTGSSVFDFDGDGVAEVVYADQQWLRVYDGPTGDVRFCLCNTSATLWEYPVVVDVDADGHAELVVASNDYASGSGCVSGPDLGECENARITAGETTATHGIRVFASPTRDWVGTRPIWNQHTYHVTNVTRDGAIPRVERANWRRTGLNDFRLNVQPGATNLPDLVPVDLSVDRTACTASMTLNFRVRNEGWSASPAGVVVAVYVEAAAGSELLARVTTTRALLPGEAESFEVVRDLSGMADEEQTFTVVVGDDGDPETPDLVECRPDNNQATTTASCDILL